MDVIDDGPDREPPDGKLYRARRSRGARALGALLVVAVAVALAVSAVGRKPGGGSAVPTAPAPGSSSPSASKSSVGSKFPVVIVVVGGESKELEEVTADGARELEGLPFGASGVWATTLPTLPLMPTLPPGAVAGGDARVVHVFGVTGGHAFGMEVRSASTVQADLGEASAVLDARELPVLVRGSGPVTVNTPGDPAVALPPGWQPAHIETAGSAGYAAVLVRPAAGPAGAVEIASWSSGGAPQVLSQAGQLLGVTPSGQAIWLSPGCPRAADCALFFGDVAGLHPPAGLPAPAGYRYAQPAGNAVSYGVGSLLAVVGTRSDDGAPQLLVADPWRGAVAAAPGGTGVMASAGMFWATGSRLVFAQGSESGPARLAMYDADTGVVTPFGPPLPRSVQLLTAYGAASGVTVRP